MIYTVQDIEQFKRFCLAFWDLHDPTLSSHRYWGPVPRAEVIVEEPWRAFQSIKSRSWGYFVGERRFNTQDRAIKAITRRAPGMAFRAALDLVKIQYDPCEFAFNHYWNEQFQSLRRVLSPDDHRRVHRRDKSI